jgi:L-ascorbate metabolism protein UlaG (beta-lactamase superfamily)
MDITYLGHSSFKLKGKTASVITDPFSPEMVGLKYPKVSADIVTVSHDHKDHNQADLVKDTRMVINTPGEYEIMGISIIGIPTFHDDKKGALRGKNTIFVIEIEDIRVAHLGDLGHVLSEKTIDKIGEVDILLIPIGGEYTINPSQSAQIVRDMEPNIAIPMHYKVDGMDEKTFGKLSDEKSFLAEVGYMVERTDKLVIKKVSLEEEKKVVVINTK